MVERQTREFEGLVVEIPCGFKSRPAHHTARRRRIGMTAKTDPVLAELWDNPKDARYDGL